MLLEYFTRIPEFADLPSAELRALAAASHVLCVPPGRQLIRSRRSPRQASGYLYLLRGSLQLSPGRYKLKARRSGTLPYFFPGCERARTLSTCQILRVDARHREFALHRCGVGALPVAGGSESWLQRFLSSSMMRRLSPAEWQRVLAAFTSIQFSAGTLIVKRGQSGDACFVMESGEAQVHVAGRVLAHLRPGDFFGEDALLLEGRRTANVSAVSDVSVRRISREVFLQVLAAALIEWVPAAGNGRRLVLAGPSAPGGVPVEGLREWASRTSDDRPVFVSGGNRRQRALAAFLLIQRGIQAYPIDREAMPEQSGVLPIRATREYSPHATRRSGRSDSVRK